MAETALVKWLRDVCIDYDGTDIPDAGATRTWLTCGEIRGAADEIDRLRAVLSVILQGNYPRPVGAQWNPDKPSKHDRCIHNAWLYETCEGCLDAFVAAALKGTDNG